MYVLKKLGAMALTFLYVFAVIMCSVACAKMHAAEYVVADCILSLCALPAGIYAVKMWLGK